MKIIDPFYKKADPRGKLAGILRTQIREINWVETKQGIIRGGHYHNQTVEYLFFVIGKARVWCTSKEGKILGDRVMEPGEIIMLEPGEVHFVEALENCIWFNALNLEIDDRSPDIHRPQTTDL